MQIEKIKYWIDISDYDFNTAQAMRESKRYLYVGFMCHQTIEKIFKAYYVKSKNDNPPFTHNLSLLAKKGDFYDLFTEEQKNFIDQIEPLNIEARYPAYKDRLLKSLNQKKCIELIRKTKNLQTWIKKKL